MQTADTDLLDIDPFGLVEDEPPPTRAREAFSPAVRLMMLARSVEAIETVLRAGKAVKVNRGKGGKFAKKGAADIAQAAVAAVDPDRRRMAFGRMDASFDADWRTTGAANSRANAQRRYVSGEPAESIAADLRRDADELDRRADSGDMLPAEVRDGRVTGPEELALIIRNDAKQMRRLADNLERESRPRDPVPESPPEPSAPAAAKPRRSAVAKALASGDPNALDGVSREALRREAKARGLEPRRGVTEDELRDMLWDDEGTSKGDGDATPVPAPAPGAENPVDVLKSAQAGDSDKVRALLENMSDAQLHDTARQLAGEMGTVPLPKRGQSRQKLIDDIHEGTVGFRDRWKAIGGWGRANDTPPEPPKRAAPRLPSRPRTAGDPAPYTPPTLDSTRKQDALAISGGRDVWAEMAAERDQKGAAPKRAPAAKKGSAADKKRQAAAEKIAAAVNRRAGGDAGPK